MIRTTLITASLIALSACATTSPPPDIEISDLQDALQPATRIDEDPVREVRIVERVETLPLPGQLRRVTSTSPRPDISPTEAIRRGVAEARIEPSEDGYVNAVQVFPYSEGALYRLYCAPGQITDIALQPGEDLVSVSAGDTVRWVVGDTRSGSGATSRAHVLVKPHSSGLTTNLMIATDRRTYYLELESTDAAYMAALSWRYPGDELEQIRADYAGEASRTPNSIAPGISLDQMNFDYHISGDSPDWKPIRAFDDGRQVFIQMPESIGATDMPPLFVMGGSGDAELVNYRVRGRYYVVDRLFDVAELRHGGRRQEVVRIAVAPARRNLLQEIFGG
jgi:type IV secretion system protein VirB9